MKISHKLENAFVLSILAAFTGGSVAVAAKIALEVFQPFTLVFIRFLFATLFLTPFIQKTGEFNIKNIKTFIPIGIVGALNPILLFIALQWTQASVSPLIYASVPAMTAFYLYFIRGQKIDSKHIVGIGIGFLGVAMIVILPLLDRTLGFDALKGNILIFAAAIAFMVYGIMSKQKQNKINASPTALTFYFSLITLILSIPLAGYEMSHSGFLGAVELKHIVGAIYTGVVGTGIFYLAYQYALKVGSELAAALFTYLQPIATIILAVLFLGEHITVPFLIGGFLAIIGARMAAKKFTSTTPKGSS
jgi:drug/metabolite transporter (DMT)-like permease